MYQLIQRFISGLDPNVVMKQMMNNNPQFKAFVEQNKGLSANQIAQKYNIDINSLNRMFK